MVGHKFVILLVTLTVSLQLVASVERVWNGDANNDPSIIESLLNEDTQQLKPQKFDRKQRPVPSVYRQRRQLDDDEAEADAGKGLLPNLPAVKAIINKRLKTTKNVVPVNATKIVVPVNTTKVVDTVKSTVKDVEEDPSGAEPVTSSQMKKLHDVMVENFKNILIGIKQYIPKSSGADKDQDDTLSVVKKPLGPKKTNTTDDDTDESIKNATAIVPPKTNLKTKVKVPAKDRVKRDASNPRFMAFGLRIHPNMPAVSEPFDSFDEQKIFKKRLADPFENEMPSQFIPGPVQIGGPKPFVRTQPVEAPAAGTCQCSKKDDKDQHDNAPIIFQPKNVNFFNILPMQIKNKVEATNNILQEKIEDLWDF